MIEYEGWIFDFERMDCLSNNGKTLPLMKLGDMFYVHTGNVYNASYTWSYINYDKSFSKEVYRRYEIYLFESIFFDT